VGALMTILLLAFLASFVFYIVKARTLVLLIGVPAITLILLRLFVHVMVE
jgi:hypothetical protein